MKILVIDDEPLALKLLTHQLANIGFTDVITHLSARDALAFLGRSPSGTDVVITDLQMPDMDGVEVVRHLGEMGYAGDLVLISGEEPRILQTARSLAQAHRLRVLGALSKPVLPEQLDRVLQRHAQASSVASANSRQPLGPADVQRAIAQGELVNYYEPKIDVATGAVAGVEALVRWRHPVLGLVYPGEFVALAEEHDLIDPLTRAVLIAAVRQVADWHAMGLRLRVSVNISMGNLNDLGFPDFVADEAAKAGLPLSSLVLEITESRVMQDLLMPLDILTRLRLKHIGLSIDDFGTGHSSLSQLRDIPFDELKIDRGFVHRAATDPSRRAIFEASLDMARKLGMHVVAEGVEVRADWDFVCSAGCEYAQGYFIGRAMPADSLPDWVEQWSSRYRELQGVGK